MSVIPGSSYTSRVLVDGTLAIVIHVEPQHRNAALQLFGAPGTPVALAALATAAQESQPQRQRERMAPLCELAVKLCREPMFSIWCKSRIQADPQLEWALALSAAARSGSADEELCKALICHVCCVESRKDIDGNPEATRRFHELVRKPYQAWLERKWVTT